MKSINQILSTNSDLKDIDEIRNLIEYCQELEDEVIELKQVDVSVMENKLTYLVRDIYHGINETLQQDANSIRFGETDRVDFEESVKNLKEFLLDFSRTNKFNF
tara:strand:- start:104 stop:415 length:312 start_codon:yes stop_codon:yes gene_type:complete